MFMVEKIRNNIFCIKNYSVPKKYETLFKKKLLHYYHKFKQLQ